MDVAVDRHGGANLVVPLHAADRHRHVMNHAKAFAVIGESVVEAAADVEGHAILEGMLGGQNRTARSQPESMHQLRRVGNLHLLLFAGGKRSGFQLLHVLRSVDQQNVLVRCGLRSYEVGRLRLLSVSSNRSWMRRYFSAGKTWLPIGRIVVVAVDELEGKHGRTVVGCQSSVAQTSGYRFRLAGAGTTRCRRTGTIAPLDGIGRGLARDSTSSWMYFTKS